MPAPHRRFLCTLALLCCATACRKPAPPPAPVPAQTAPSPLDLRLAALPDPLARIDNVTIPRANIAADLRALVQGQVLAPQADDITWQRTVATRLETRIDELLVGRELTPQQLGDATTAAQASVAAEQQRFGGPQKWLDSLTRRGETAAMHLDALTFRHGLAVLARRDPASAVPEAELRERFELQNKALAQTGRPPLTFEAARPALLANLARMREFAAGRTVLAKLRAAARIVRTPPFDHPPGGLPLAGTVTATLPEPDDD